MQVKSYNIEWVFTLHAVKGTGLFVLISLIP